MAEVLTTTCAGPESRGAARQAGPLFAFIGLSSVAELTYVPRIGDFGTVCRMLWVRIIGGMGSGVEADVRVGEIDRTLLGLSAEVWWSPADSAYIAYSIEFAALVCSDPYSSLAAIDKLETRIRGSMLAAARRIGSATPVRNRARR